MSDQRKIQINEYHCLSIAKGKLSCPLQSTPETNAYCYTTCAWFSIIGEHAMCQGEIIIGSVDLETQR